MAEGTKDKLEDPKYTFNFEYRGAHASPVSLTTFLGQVSFVHLSANLRGYLCVREVDIMKCPFHNSEVKVEHCEPCLGERRADPVCFKRGFTWGVPDGAEPRWVLSLQEAIDSKEDVSHYFIEQNNYTKEFSVGRRKETIPPDLRWEIWERDNFTCQECGVRRYLSIDHIFPESRGGSLDKSNLQTLCKRCNSIKGAKVYAS